MLLIIKAFDAKLATLHSNVTTNVSQEISKQVSIKIANTEKYISNRLTDFKMDIAKQVSLDLALSESSLYSNIKSQLSSINTDIVSKFTVFNDTLNDIKVAQSQMEITQIRLESK